MPIYEYICRNCGKKTDVLQKMTDAPAVHCEKCGTDGLEKMISAPSFQLKGSGWYATDFKGKAADTSEKTETKTDDTSSGSCGQGGCGSC